MAEIYRSNKREIQLIRKKACGKKSAQKKELLDTPCGSNIKTVVEEHIILSENIYSIQ